MPGGVSKSISRLVKLQLLVSIGYVYPWNLLRRHVFDKEIIDDCSFIYILCSIGQAKIIQAYNLI